MFVGVDRRETYGATARVKLVREFGSLDAVLDRAPAVSAPRLAAALRDHRALAELTRRLVTIDCQTPVVESLEHLEFHGADRDPARNFLFSAARNHPRGNPSPARRSPARACARLRE